MASFAMMTAVVRYLRRSHSCPIERRRRPLFCGIQFASNAAVFSGFRVSRKTSFGRSSQKARAFPITTSRLRSIPLHV